MGKPYVFSTSTDTSARAATGVTAARWAAAMQAILGQHADAKWRADLTCYVGESGL